MKKILLLLIIFILASSAVFSDTKNPERPLDLSLELNQMLRFQLGIEYFFNDSLGLKVGAGLSPIGITCVTYNALFVYHLNIPAEHFQLDIEAGLPIAYFDFIEGRYVDWDSAIDDPYYGFLIGGGLLTSYRFNDEQALGLRTAVAVMFEHQRDSGWKDRKILPVIAIVYNF